MKHQFFTNDKSFIITGDRLEYLAAFLNSKIFKFTFIDFFPELLGESRELRKVFFENVSVRLPEDDSWYAKHVNLIVERKKRKIDTSALEHEIDEKLFDLYEVTESEVALIDAKLGVLRGSEKFMSPISSVERE